MSTEVSRETSVRRITAPDNDATYVDLKVNDKIRFIDPKQNYQEWELSFSNNDNADRRVHVVEVGDDKLKVERIDWLQTIHSDSGHFQEWQSSYENSDDPPVHFQTHKRKIYSLNDDKTKNESIWIEVQRIDAIWFKDVRGQERVWYLDWPDLQDDEWDYKDLSQPDKRWDGTEINPPWRLDPFQTIVDCSFGALSMMVLYGRDQIAAIPMASLTKPKPSFKTRSKVVFDPPQHWFPSIGPGYFQVAQIKTAKNIHAMSTQIDFSGQSAQPASDWFKQYVYNTAVSLFSNAKACTPLTRTGVTLDWEQAEISLHMEFGNHLATISAAEGFGYLRYSDGDIGYGDGSTSSWDGFGYGVFWKREHRTGTNFPTPWSAWEYGFGPYTDAPWWVYTGPVINASADGKIYNERGDVFATDKNGVRLVTAGDTTSRLPVYRLTPDAAEQVGEIPMKPAADPITYAPLDGAWTTYLLASTVDVNGKISDGWNNYDPYFGTGDVRRAVLKQNNKLDVFKSEVKSITGTDFGLGVDTPPVRIFNFPYNISDDISKTWAFADDGTDTNEFGQTEWTLVQGSQASFPLKGGHILTPYGKFDAPAGNFAFQGWLSLHNGEHNLQAFILRSSPSTFKRYIYLDGKDYGAKLAAALGCSIDEIRAIYFDIKSSDIQKLGTR